jgi:hypothetical protein
MVAHTCNSSYSRDRDQEDRDSRPVQKKVNKTPSQQISQVWWHMLIIPATKEAWIGELWFEAGPGLKHETLSEK